MTFVIRNPVSDDTNFMKIALGLAARGQGIVWPNPAVGCVLVRPDLGRNGQVVGRGWTQPGGRPHAETEALSRAGEMARGATAYVTLEPCAHQGETPSCAEALAAAGVKRAVVALGDPDPRTNGGGLEKLRQAGVEVFSGVLEEEAAQLCAGYLTRIREGRPLVTLKVATTLDGKIATRAGHSQWITGPGARRRGHLMRAQNDGIMVGAGTVAADDPDLTCRLPGLGNRSPVRIVADGRLRTPLTSKLVQKADKFLTWIIAMPGAEPSRLEALAQAGVEVIEVSPDDTGNPDLIAALKMLGERGMTSLLVEGGSRLASSLLLAGLVDRIAWFRAPRVMGGEGVPVVAALGLDNLGDAPDFKRVDVTTIGDDILETYVIRV